MCALGGIARASGGGCGFVRRAGAGACVVPDSWDGRLLGESDVEGRPSECSVT